MGPVHSAPPPERDARSSELTLSAFRWVMTVGAIGIPLFWALYRVIDPTYTDPVEARLAFSVVLLTLVVLTFMNPWVRRYVWHAGAGVACAGVAYFSWLGGVNGLDAPWTVGILVAGSGNAVALSLYSRTVGGVWGWTMGLVAIMSAALALSGAAAIDVALVVSCFALFAVLVGITGGVHVRSFLDVRESRDALAARERLLRTLIDTLPDPLYVRDLEGRCVTRNLADARRIGADRVEDTVGLTVHDTYPDALAGDVAAADAHVLETGETLRDQETLWRDGGVDVWYATTTTPLRDESGSVIGLVGVSRDVTEEKRASAEAVQAKEGAEAATRQIAESQGLLWTVLDSNPDLVRAVDRAGRFTLLNRAAARALGADHPAQISKLPVLDLIPGPAGDAIREVQDRVMDTGEADVDRPETIVIAGQERHFSVTRLPRRDEGGAVVGCVEFHRDVTEARRAEAELREAKQAAEAREHEAAAGQRLLRTLIDAVPDHIYAKDIDGRATLRNVASAGALGYDRVEDALDDTDAEAPVDWLGAQSALADDLRVIGTGEPIVDREEPIHVGDEIRWLSTTKVPLRDEGGAVVGLVGISRDVTEAKWSAIELTAAKEVAEASTRAKSEFLANMSHEIRTPMNGVVGMTSLLLETALDDEQRDFVETIRTSGDALLTLINDILDFSKIEAGQLDLEEAPFDVRPVVEDALDLVAPLASDKGIELAYLVADGVPGAVRGDASRVRQVIVNLLSNAVKFTPDGSVCVRVTAGAAPPGDDDADSVLLHVSVEDTGIGIAPDKVDHVFGSFTQADASTTRQYGGTGLGLAISKRLVEMMGGTIGVTSELGVGSSFSFSVRVGAVEDRLRTFARPDPSALRGLRLLAVDDNAVNREIVVHLATRWGMDAEAVASGPEGVAVVEAAARAGRPVDAVVLDMQMPEMDGLDVAQALAALPAPPSAVVMLTSITRDRELRDQALAAGVHSVLYKPTKPAPLFDALRDALGAGPGAPAAPPRDDPADSAPMIVRAEPREAPSAVSRRILLAEDNVVNQKVALRLLDKLGYSADVAADGTEVLEMLALRPYDLILMDVQMPRMDGLEATRRIRTDVDAEVQPYILALTANAMEGDRERCLEAGTDAYLAKPVSLDALRAAIAAIPASRTAPAAAPPAA